MKQSRKRRALRVGRQTEELFSTPASPVPFESSLTQPRTEEEKNSQYRTQALMNLIHYANVMEMFKKSISRFKGTNNPVSYKDSYNFSQKWEEASKATIEKNQNIYLAANGIYFIISMLVLLHKIPMIWFLSIYKIFQLQGPNWWFKFGIIFALIDLSLRIYLIYRQFYKHASKQETSQKQFTINMAWLFVGDFITLLCFLIEMFILDPKGGIEEIILNYIVVFIQAKRFLQIYNALVIMLISHKYKNTVNLFGFMGKLFVSLHICAIVVYAVTFMSPAQNWLHAIGKNGTDQITQYVYSIYFIGTTMLTVGYGDILPINNFEIILILIIQVLGTVLSGYIISEIGHILTAMRQERDDFEQDIQNADTICSNYQLDHELKHRVRNYIVNNRLANQELNVKEQNNFLMKLSEELRNQVNNVNHLNIIKTSLFFICHWSKKMQTDLSKKLQKFIFAPNERISKLNKVYIVTNGKVDIYTERKIGEKTFCKKYLKTIHRDPKKEVFSNVYGSTSLLTGKPCQLAAVAKNFAICYALDYSDFMETVRCDDRDFELYHQTKVKLEQEEFPEKFQIPDLINNRQHYCPSKYWVVKKYKKNIKIFQKRQQCRRNLRKMKKVYLHEPEIGESDSDIESMDDNFDNDMNIPDLSSIKLDKEAPPSLVKIESKKSCLTFRSYRRRYLSKLDEEKAKANEMNRLLKNHVVETSQFETGREYIKYFKYGNLSTVLKKMKRNEFKYLNGVNSKKMQLDWIDLLIFAQKFHKGNNES